MEMSNHSATFQSFNWASSGRRCFNRSDWDGFSRILLMTDMVLSKLTLLFWCHLSYWSLFILFLDGFIGLISVILSAFWVIPSLSEQAGDSYWKYMFGEFVICWCHVDNLCEWNWSSFIEIKLTLWRMLWWDLLKFDQPSAGCLYLSWFVVAICFVKVGWQDRAGVYRMSGRIWLFISREMLAILPQVCLWEWIWTVVLPPIIATFS